MTIEVVKRAEPAPRPVVTAAAPPPNTDAEAQGVFKDAQKELTSKNYEQAAMLFGRASKLNPRWKDPLVQKAILESKLGLFKLVLEDCDEALRLDPNDAETHNYRGFALYSLNRNKEALSEFSEAIRLKPDYAEAYNNRGNTEVQMHDEQNAKTDFATARTLQSGRKK